MSGSGSVDVDVMLRVLANSRRRHAIACLQRHDTITLPDLAEEVTVRETDKPITEIPAEEVTDVYFSLYHSHVPKLEHADLLRYHQEQDLVSCEDGVDQAVERAREEIGSLLDDSAAPLDG